MSTIIQNKRGTASQWTSLNPVLYAGEFGWETDTNRFKIGNGTTAWNSLPYASPALAASVPSGGTTGQILAKNSGTDYDTGWIDNYPSQVQQYVKNGSGSTLYKGQAVYVTGASGANVLVGLSQANAEATSSKTLGLLMQDLAPNAFGYVLTDGTLTGLNTSAAGNEGDAVWLSPTTAGGLVYGLSNKPSAPYHMVYIGVVTRKNSNNGSILVKVQNGFEVEELHNAAISGLADKDLFVYENSTSLWKNKSFSTLGLATSSYVDTSIANLVASAPSTLDTLNELAAALGNDANFATTITNSLAGKVSLTGSYTNPSWLVSIPFSKITSTPTTLSGYGITDSPVASSTNPLMDGTVAVGTSTTYARADHVHPSDTAKANLSGGNAFTGSQTVTTSATGDKPLILNAPTGVLVNLQDWQVNGAALARVSPNGSIATSGNLAVGSTSITGTNQLQVTSTSATNIGAVIRGAASQTANLQEWQDSAGAVQTLVNSGGAIASGQRATFGSTTVSTAGHLSVILGVDRVGLAVRGSSSQTANLQEWQNSAGTVNAGINAVGQIYSGSNTPQQGQGTTAIGIQTPTGTTNITITTGTNHGISVGQTVVIAGVTPSGYNGTWIAQTGTTGTTLVVNIGSNPGAITVAGTVTASATLSVTALSSKNTPIVVRAASGQAFNLLEVQNSSGASQFTVTPTGGLLSYQPSQFQTFTTTNTPLKIVGASNQIQDLLQIQNSGSTATAGVSAIGQIYTGATGVKMGNQTIAINTQTPTGTTLISITTASAHGIQVGQSVTIAGVTPTGYNGLWFAQAGTTGSTLVINIGSNPGAITVAGTVQSSAQLSVIAPNANTTPVVVQGAGSQVNNLQEWQNSGGTAVASVSPAGQLRAVGIAAGDGSTAILLTGSRNIQLFAGSSSYGGGLGVMGIANANTVPTSNPTGGGILYVDTGALKYRGTSGSAATIVNADGTDPNAYTLQPASASTLGGVKVGSNLSIDGSGTLSAASYTLPPATSTTLGGVELFDNTTQTTAANAVTSTANRTYGLQLNSAQQGVINVPWTDTDTTYTLASGTNNGTLKLTASSGGIQDNIAVTGLGSNAFTSTAIPSPSSTTPLVDGTAAVGIGTTYARADHVHPTDTSRADSSHTHGNVLNGGTMTTSVTATNPVKVVITDSGNNLGLLTTTGASSTTFLRGDGTWATPAAGGGSGFTGAGTSITNITGAADNNMTITSAASGNGSLTLNSLGTGNVNINAGSGASASTTVSVNNITLTGGTNTGNGLAGHIYLTGGTANGTGSGGDVVITGGNSGSGNGGNVYIGIVDPNLLQGAAGSINIGTTSYSTVNIGGVSGGILNLNMPVSGFKTAGSSNLISFGSTSLSSVTARTIDANSDILTFTNSSTAFGRGIVRATAMAFSTADGTSATTTTSQSIFQSGARTLSLEAGKTYYFRLNLTFNFTYSTVPAAIQLVPTFSNTPVAINYSAMFISGTSGGVQGFRITSTGAQSISPTLGASTTGSNVFVEGFFQSNATTGGTVEFKYQISTGGGSSAVAKTGCLQEVMKIGSGAPGIISGAWA